MTAKSVTITVSGKRNVGDDGNDFISGLSFANGQSAQAGFQWILPNGSTTTTVTFDDAVINVTNMNTGEAADVGPLEWEMLSNGKPTYTPVA